MGPWRPSVHMPKWATRPQRWELINVRPERLHNITAEDVVAEGIPFADFCPRPIGLSEDKTRKLLDKLGQHAFGKLWDTINKKRGYPWEMNPWVWRLEWDPKPVEGREP